MQAARGASLTSESADQDKGRPGAAVPTFAVTALAAYLLDVGTKILAVHELPGRHVHVFGELLTLTLVRNPGAAFSTGTGHTALFTSLAIIASVVVLWVARRVGTRLWGTALGLLLAGITGNLTDRIFREPGVFRGHVIDFFSLPHWPVFNVADICIDAAVALIILQAFRGIRLDGRREVRK